jgi:hypothetical protein
MEDQARLGPLSLLVKGEVSLSGKAWAGSPISAATPVPLAEINSDKKLQTSKAFC